MMFLIIYIRKPVFPPKQKQNQKTMKYSYFKCFTFFKNLFKSCFSIFHATSNILMQKNRPKLWKIRQYLWKTFRLYTTISFIPFSFKIFMHKKVFERIFSRILLTPYPGNPPSYFLFSFHKLCVYTFSTPISILFK